MGSEKSMRLQGRVPEDEQEKSARKHGTSHQPPGSQLDEEAQRISRFRVEGANNVNVGSTSYVKGGPIININIDLGELIYAVSTHENYHNAYSLPPDLNYRDNPPCTRSQSTDRPTEQRSRHTQNDMVTPNTRHKTAVDSLSGHQESLDDQHTPLELGNAKTLAEEKRRHRRHQPQIQHEGKIGWRQRLRDWMRRNRRGATRPGYVEGT
ncbi:hypothetical protein F4680DRAFT_205581 [Xylaria scruposa]|nr:hypothetical protein F4680DRAFT_205581 [Xylaria scruposa]